MLTEQEITCQFCEFEYGVSRSVIRKKESNKIFIWEIRPNLSGQYMLFVRVFGEQIGDIVDKSVMFIKYCPMCGRKL